jgi:hypothetical protein
MFNLLPPDDKALVLIELSYAAPQMATIECLPWTRLQPLNSKLRLLGSIHLSLLLPVSNGTIHNCRSIRLTTLLGRNWEFSSIHTITLMPFP